MGKPWEIVVGEVRRVLRGMPADSFDACLSDPPYGLKFMGNQWDYSVPSVNTWVELRRVLKPGAYAMLFGGTKTFHRLMVSVEDGGLLPIDTCMWMHGKGFPKNHDVSKAIDAKLGAKRTKVVGHKQSGLDMVTSGTGKTITFARGEKGRTGKGRDETGLIPITEAATPQAARWNGYGTALKPAWEPIMLACKLHDGTYAENVLRHGTGALAIDACRVGVTGCPTGHSYAKTGLFGMGGKAIIEALNDGRWPANIVLSHDDECVEVECAHDCPVRLLDEQSGNSRSPGVSVVHRKTMSPGSVGIAPRAEQEVIRGFSDFGGASRFYYVTKASRVERDRGLEGTTIAESADAGALRDGGRGKAAVHNDHPTVKPIDLCRYFARLLLPPPREDGKPRRIIVPFSGSGSEMIGCLQAGWDEVVGIELNPKHAEKARLRISRGKIIQNVKK